MSRFVLLNSYDVIFKLSVGEQTHSSHVASYSRNVGPAKELINLACSLVFNDATTGATSQTMMHPRRLSAVIYAVNIDADVICQGSTQNIGSSIGTDTLDTSHDRISFASFRCNLPCHCGYSRVLFARFNNAAPTIYTGVN